MLSRVCAIRSLNALKQTTVKTSRKYFTRFLKIIFDGIAHLFRILCDLPHIIAHYQQFVNVTSDAKEMF